MPKPFHSPNSLNLGLVSSNTILITRAAIIRLLSPKLVKVPKLFCLELLATLLLAIRPLLLASTPQT